MPIGKYIFVIFLSLFVKKIFRGMDIGRGPRASRILKFSHQTFCEKLFSLFRVVKMLFCHFWPSLQKYFGPPLENPLLAPP